MTSTPWGSQNDFALGLTYYNQKWIMVGNVDTDATAGVNYALGTLRYGSDGN
ncbi:MAG: hypothetical protein R3B54_04615 [Bdellovibrionota bacterium]